MPWAVEPELRRSPVAQGKSAVAALDGAELDADELEAGAELDAAELEAGAELDAAELEAGAELDISAALEAATLEATELVLEEPAVELLSVPHAAKVSAAAVNRDTAEILRVMFTQVLHTSSGRGADRHECDEHPGDAHDRTLNTQGDRLTLTR
ncbi:hypothetical protein [Nakamurella antarctica]|uniref:hypothetical protein n=1 Tax=Nakamurella antarctica TaxID=1902245 RepID=UPI001EF0D52D|nr:hypothetical protein [Nakamurella antarctica]